MRPADQWRGQGKTWGALAYGGKNLKRQNYEENIKGIISHTQHNDIQYRVFLITT